MQGQFKAKSEIRVLPLYSGNDTERSQGCECSFSPPSFLFFFFLQSYTQRSDSSKATLTVSDRLADRKRRISAQEVFCAGVHRDHCSEILRCYSGLLTHCAKRSTYHPPQFSVTLVDTNNLHQMYHYGKLEVGQRRDNENWLRRQVRRRALWATATANTSSHHLIWRRAELLLLAEAIKYRHVN